MSEPSPTNGTAATRPTAIVILGPGRSYTTVAAGIIGQHPDLLGLPEINLTMADTVDGWMQETQDGHLRVGHGLLRALAQILGGDQSAANVEHARDWLDGRRHMTTREVMNVLQDGIAPKGVVEKSPLTVMRDDYMQELVTQLPDAYYIHITRHPKTACDSMMRSRLYQALLQTGFTEGFDQRGPEPVFDPQVHWYSTHLRIIDFLDTVPAHRWHRIRGEDLLEHPDATLTDICRWAGLDDSPAAIEAMKHPENSPFACNGPPNAIWGADLSFQSDPALRPYKAKPAPLSGPLDWRDDGIGFADFVQEMAKFFGYSDGAAT